VQLGSLEVTVFDELLQEARRFAAAAAPQQLGLGLGDVLARAGVPYSMSCGGPPAPSQKYVLKDVIISQMKLYVFCHLHPSILPDMLTAMVTLLSGFASMIQVDGAVLKLAEQRFFKDGSFEGSLGSLFSKVVNRYKKVGFKALLSIVNNSNLFFGGVLTRQFWVPKHREVEALCSTFVDMDRGVVRLINDIPDRLKQQQGAV